MANPPAEWFPWDLSGRFDAPGERQIAARRGGGVWREILPVNLSKRQRAFERRPTDKIPLDTETTDKAGYQIGSIPQGLSRLARFAAEGAGQVVLISASLIHTVASKED
jgi:hypothetical protein